ncbi:uncharacterized protein PG998_010072 [Apiospora kogelbergensis]|uniref:uncharacterized protein n=1 Tax=Apiospora kogelbergensis TaxID=1337665 RepID=UPI0031311DAB
MAGAHVNREIGINKAMDCGHTKHGGLLASVHNTPGSTHNTTGTLNQQNNQRYKQPKGQRKDTRKDPRKSWHKTQNGNHNGNQNGNKKNFTTTQSPSSIKIENTNDISMGGVSVLNTTQVKPQKATKVTTLGGFYTWEPIDRDELWGAIDLKTPKYHGYDSWAIPFPAPLDFNQLVLLGYNESSIFLDERYVRLVSRTHFDIDGKEVARDLLLGPPNPSVNLQDLRFQNAMAEAWWKLVRWMDRVQSGDSVNLLSFLKADLEQEFAQKKERAL